MCHVSAYVMLSQPLACQYAPCKSTPECVTWPVKEISVNVCPDMKAASGPVPQFVPAGESDPDCS